MHKTRITKTNTEKQTKHTNQIRTTTKAKICLRYHNLGL